MMPSMLVAAASLLVTADTALPWWTQLALAAASAASAAVLGLIGRALHHAAAYLAAKTKLAKIAEVDTLIMGYVSDVYQSEVAAAKDASADGKLTDEEKAHFKQIPIEKAKEHFGLPALEQLAGGLVEEWLGSRVEHAVVMHQAAGVGVPVLPANPR